MQKMKTVVSVTLADFFIFKMSYTISHCVSKYLLVAKPALFAPFEGIANRQALIFSAPLQCALRMSGQAFHHRLQP